MTGRAGWIPESGSGMTGVRWISGSSPGMTKAKGMAFRHAQGEDIPELPIPQWNGGTGSGMTGQRQTYSQVFIGP